MVSVGWGMTACLDDGTAVRMIAYSLRSDHLFLSKLSTVAYFLVLLMDFLRAGGAQPVVDNVFSMFLFRSLTRRAQHNPESVPQVMEDVDPDRAAASASPSPSSSGASCDGSDMGDDSVGGLVADGIVDDVDLVGRFDFVGDAGSVVDLVAELLDLDQDMFGPPPADVAADIAAIGLPVYDPVTFQVMRPRGVI